MSPVDIVKYAERFLYDLDLFRRDEQKQARAIIGTYSNHHLDGLVFMATQEEEETRFAILDLFEVNTLIADLNEDLPGWRIKARCKDILPGYSLIDADHLRNRIPQKRQLNTAEIEGLMIAVRELTFLK